LLLFELGAELSDRSIFSTAITSLFSCFFLV